MALTGTGCSEAAREWNQSKTESQWGDRTPYQPIGRRVCGEQPISVHIYLILSDYLKQKKRYFLVYRICFQITRAAFPSSACPAFPPIKHEKHEKQRAVFLMCIILSSRGDICLFGVLTGSIEGSSPTTQDQATPG